MSPASLIVAGLVGLAIGGVHAGGLWLTVRTLQRVRRPSLVLLVSAALRIALVVGVAFVLYANDLAALAAMMAGFLIARVAATRFVGSPAISGSGEGGR